MTHPERLTILVTTYNRYRRLRRLLRYAISVKTPYRILVLDSSSEPCEVSGLRELLTSDGVRHLTFAPSVRPLQKLFEGLQEVSTPYVVVWADDDFLIPRSLTEGVRFLETYPDYSIVHGAGMIFTIEGHEGRAVPGCMPYWQRALTAATPSARLREHFLRYSVLNYSIHRTPLLQHNVGRCCEHRFGFYWAELTLGGLSVIQGNAHKMDRLYLVKETHAGSGMVHPETWQEPGPTACLFDRTTDAGFPGAYAAFRDCLAQELVQREGLDFRQAQEVVKEGFWFYLSSNLRTNWRVRYAPAPTGWAGRVRRAARGIPTLRTAWRETRALVPRSRKSVFLPALLRTSSWYHVDFMPVYRAMILADAAKVDF